MAGLKNEQTHTLILLKTLLNNTYENGYDIGYVLLKLLTRLDRGLSNIHV